MVRAHARPHRLVAADRMDAVVGMTSRGSALEVEGERQASALLYERLPACCFKQPRGRLSLWSGPLRIGSLQYMGETPATCEDTGTSGLPVHRLFCPKCGSPICRRWRRPMAVALSAPVADVCFWPPWPWLSIPRRPMTPSAPSGFNGVKIDRCGLRQRELPSRPRHRREIAHESRRTAPCWVLLRQSAFHPDGRAGRHGLLPLRVVSTLVGKSGQRFHHVAA